MGLMIKLDRALVILPGDPSEESSEYREACEAVGLRPSRHGHAIYLLETAAGSLTLFSAELGEPGLIRGAGRVRGDWSGSRRSGEQHGETAPLRGIRTSAGDAELVEIGPTGRGHPIARVVVRTRTSNLHGSVSSSPEPETSTAPGPGAAQLWGPIGGDVHQALADVLAETLVSALWPAAPEAGPLADYDSLYRAAEILLEPEALLLMLINASVRAAAHALGVGILAPVIGRLAEDLCAPLLHPSPENQAASDLVKIIDIDLYMAGGQPAACPALRELTTETVAGVIGTLLTSRPSPHKDGIVHLRPGPDTLPTTRPTNHPPAHRSQSPIPAVPPGPSSDVSILVGKIFARERTESAAMQPARNRGPAKSS